MICKYTNRINVQVVEIKLITKIKVSLTLHNLNSPYPTYQNPTLNHFRLLDLNVNYCP